MSRTFDATRIAQRLLSMWPSPVILRTYPCTLPVEGNALDSGDEAIDRACEEEIKARQRTGDEYAWFNAIVYIELSGETHLRTEAGAYSCLSEADFREHELQGMVEEILIDAYNSFQALEHLLFPC